MITINLSPVFSDEDAVSIEVIYDTVIINGEEFDFTELPKGHHMDCKDIESEWFVDTVYKDDDGNMIMTIRFPHPTEAGEEMRFPLPITVIENGFLDLPKYTPPIKIDYENIPEVTDNEETGLFESEANTDYDRLGDVGETTIRENLPSGDGLVFHSIP